MIKDIISSNDKINVTNNKMDKLKELFPNCFNKNGEFDITSFEEEIKTSTSVLKEGYGLNFLGKSYAKYIASIDTETILVPDEDNNSKEENKNSENIYISGDNIDALKHLVKSYANKIKCIYIDPPYNTGSDGFVYNDKFNFTNEKLADVLDINEEETKRINSMTNAKSNSHSAWLTFMYPRLYLAKKLLSNDGVMFISIDENEDYNLKSLCARIFGEENIDSIIWQKTDSQVDRNTNSKIINRFKSEHETIVICYNNRDITTFNKIYKLPDWKNEQKNVDNDPRGPWMSGIISYEENHKNEDKNSEFYYEITTPSGKKIQRHWYYYKKDLLNLIADNRIYFPKNGDGVPRLKVFENEEKEYYMGSILRGLGTSSTAKDELELYFGERDIFDTPKPTKLIKELVRATSNENDIVLDFFSGSSSTAESVMQLCSENFKRKYIMVQLPELCDVKKTAYKNGYKTIDEIGQERIRRAAKKIKAETNADIDYGFKHYTIKEVNTNTLDKLEKFEPNFVYSDKTIVDEFGINSILTTWMVKDGYGLTDKYEKLVLEEYEAYKCKNTIYLINPDISSEAIKCLIEKYEENFDCNRIVLFGYSFTLSEIQTLKDNLKQVKNIKNINVDVLTRY